MQLYNKLSALERARIIDENSQERITLSFYKYFKLGNPSLFRDHLFIVWSDLDVLGRIYVANEGINAQLSVPSENLEIFKKSINDISDKPLDSDQGIVSEVPSAVEPTTSIFKFLEGPINFI